MPSSSATKTFVARVFRNLIHYQIRAFRHAFWYNNKKPVCPVSGQKLYKTTCHVDHIPPYTFDALLTEFLKQNNLTYEKIETVGYRRKRKLKDSELQFRWLEFHERNAKLRVVSKKANLSTIRKMKTNEKPVFKKSLNKPPRKSDKELFDAFED